MRYFTLPALAVVLAALAAPAFAQLSQGGLPGAGGGPAPQPKARVPDIAPPALPGAGDVGGVATGPVVHKAVSGDPTTALFSAINSNDYNGAQDALSRGADLNQQNALGETPLDLAVALNRNSITFLLLGTRNETAGGTDVQGPPISLADTKAVAHKKHVKPALQGATVSPPVPGNLRGTPDPSAGFLGFGTNK
jgi:hypothetical protein